MAQGAVDRATEADSASESDHAATGLKRAAGGRTFTRRRASVRAYLFVPAFVFALAAGANVLYQRQAATHDALESAADDASFGARLAARELGAGIAQTQSGLVTTAADPSLAGVFAAPAGCTLTFSTSAPLVSGHLDIVDRNGTVVCSSLVSSAAGEYATASWLPTALKTTGVVAPTLDARTGKQSIVVAAPIGAQGTLVTILDLESLGPGLTSSYGGPRALEFVVTSADHATVLTRSVEAHHWAGTPLKASALTQPGAHRERRDLDGKTRIYGQATAKPVGWTIYAGATKSQAVAAATALSNRQLAITLIGVLLFVALVAVVYRRITRPIGQLSAGVRAASADLSADPIAIGGPQEVSTLVDDFNRLIAAARREREVTSRFLAIVESSPDAIVGTTVDGDVTSWNAGAERLYGFTAADMAGQQNARLHVPADRVDEATDLFARALAGERIQQFATQRLHKDGHVLDVETSIAAIRDASGAVIGASSITRDLTERHRAEAERFALEQQLLVAELVAEQEREFRLLAERERIGRDLHDTVIQRLFAIGMTLESMSSRIPDEDVKTRVAGAVDDLDATIRRIRSVIFDMGSGGGSGLRGSVLQIVEEATASLGFTPSVEFTGPVDTLVPPHISDQLLATLREALSNVTRHAHAHSVNVQVSVGDDVVLAVIDDGVGIDDAAARAGGLGLTSMRARAERLGGQCSVAATTAGGTRVEWRVHCDT